MKNFRLGALALCVAACGGGSSAPPDGGFSYSGTAGQPVAANFGSDLLPDVAVKIGSGQTHVLTVDTGAPVVTLDTSTFTDHTAGVHKGETVTAFNLTFANVTDVAYDANGIVGIFGGDLLRHFAFSLDYTGDRAWLSDPFAAAAVPSGIAAAAEEDVSFQLLGGGTFLAYSGCTGANCAIAVPATRVLAQVTLEDQTTPIWALIDTGASVAVIDPTVFASLTSPGRPRLDGAKLIAVSGDQSSFFTRVWRVKLSGAGGTSATVDGDNIVAAVIPGTDLLSSLESETGKPVKLLLGGSFFRYFFTTVDYQASKLRLARYDDPAIDPTEWVGPGFVLDPNDYTAFEVFNPSDAYAKGLREGDQILAIGDLSLAGQPASVVQNAIASYGEGEMMPVTFMNGTQTVTVDILVENLLPDYPPPL